MAAEVELACLEEMGGLAKAIFSKIASTDGEAKGLFSTAAAAEYSKSIGREVRVVEIQPAANGLLAANLIIRRCHSVYSVSHPSVKDAWKERQAFLESGLDRPVGLRRHGAIRRNTLTQGQTSYLRGLNCDTP